MGPGLNRAVPLALAGFLLGAAFVIVLRMLQSMDPVWDAELGLLMAAFLSTVFFVWGMGAFDPKMSAHHAVEPPEYEDEATAIVAHDAHAHDEEAELEAQPVRMLSGQIWQIGFWTILLFAAIIGFATLPDGFALTVSNDAAANTAQTAMVPFQLPFSDQVITYNGEVVLFSEFAVFLVFTAFTLLSLAAIGGVVALGAFALARGVQNVKVAGNLPLYALPSGQTMEVDAVETSAPVKTRRVGDRARALTVPNLIAYAVLFPNVFIGLWLLSIFENPGRIVAAIIISHILAQIINNNLIPGKARQQTQPWLTLALNLVVLVVGWFVFDVLLDLAIQFTTGWQYAPLDPTRDALPWLSASFLAPFIVDVILNGVESYGGWAKVARLWVVTMLVFQILYIVFYGPAIGLVILGDPGRFIVSGINTVVVTLLLLRAPEVLWSLGKVAGWLANLLSKIPRSILGQK